MIDAAVFDSDGNTYTVLDALFNAPACAVKVEIKPPKTKVKASLDDLANYALRFLLEDGLITNDVTIGYAKDRLYACLSAVFAKCAIDTINNANFDPRPE